MTETKKIDLIQKAKSLFPYMPDEVFNTWLNPIIRDHNSWPYLNILSPHPSQQWSQYFGLFTLYDIAHCRWNRIELTFDTTCLDPISNNTIQALIGTHVNGMETPIRNVRNSKVRFDGLVKFIQGTRIISAPIIGINTRSGLRILDGNHRLAALTYLGLRGRVQWPTWVGA